MINNQLIIMKTFNTVMVTVVSSFFMLLFVYGAASKLIDFENFQVQLVQEFPPIPL